MLLGKLIFWGKNRGGLSCHIGNVDSVLELDSGDGCTTWNILKH